LETPTYDDGRLTRAFTVAEVTTIWLRLKKENGR
jgi:hypothetical protein